jgi:hypothetical protein
MKKIIVFTMVAAGLTIFNGCQKDELIIPEKEDVQSSYAVTSIEEDLVFSKTISVFDNSNENFVDVLISSTNEELIDYYLSVNEIKLVIDPPSLISPLKDIPERRSKDITKDFQYKIPDDCIAFEVVSANFKDERSNYILQIEKKNRLLKSYPYPPTTYYTLWKFDKRKNGKIWYFPDDTENDELLYKWGYTNSWIGKWYFDTYWRYIWGFDAVDSPMEIFHPLNNTGTYRLGIAIYYDDPNYWFGQSY